MDKHTYRLLETYMMACMEDKVHDKEHIYRVLYQALRIAKEEKQVFQEDMLFATLDTSVRHIQQPDQKSFLLSDTVGFVKKLPHHLVKAFRSTLEEAADADLLIHVVDVSNPHYKQLMQTTNETLKSIGVENVDTIYAFNKADLTEMEYPSKEGDAVYLSAKQKVGMKELTQVIRDHIFKDYVICTMLIPFEHGKLISYFNDNAHIMQTEYEENGTRIQVECKLADYDKYKDYVIS